MALLIGLLGGLAYLGYALVVLRGQDLPLLASACAVVGLVFAGIAVVGAGATYRQAASGRAGTAFGVALMGGLAGIAAFGFLAAATVFGLLWRP